MRLLSDNNRPKKYWHQRPVYEYDQADLAINGFVRDCVQCDGTGMEWGEDPHGNYYEDECDECGGTGQVGVMKY